MWFATLLPVDRFFLRRRPQHRRPALCCLTLESLEDRCVPSTYNVVDLGAFSPSAINSAGQIAGAANGRATLWQNGALTDLGTAGRANDLNDTGQVVGQSGAFLWDSSSGLRPLNFSAAYGVNSSSQVVGTSNVYNITMGKTVPHAYFWSPGGGAQDINAYLAGGGDGSEARAINQEGQVVGWTQHYISLDSGWYGAGWTAISNNAYVWDSATSTRTSVGALPGDSASRALDINNLGQVIGTSGNVVGIRYVGYVYTPREAFLWQNGVLTDLGMPSASAINDLGEVVGGHSLWQSGTLTDLNTLIDPSSGWVITSALDINDNGQIVGQGTLNGVAHSFLLDPADPSGTVGFAVTGFPASTTAGAAGSFTVTALDGSGAPASLPSLYTFTMADAGVHTFTATLKTAGTQSITLTDTAHGMSGTAGGIAVQPAAVSKLVVSSFPSPVTAGVAGSFTVTAEDAYGNSVSGYTGTIHFTSSDPKAVLPADYTFTGNSSQTFSATLKTAGAQSITATDMAMAGLAGSDAGIQVNPAAVSRLAISGPASVSVGTAFSVTVTAYDIYGNVATGYLGTVAFKSSDSTASLPANYTFTAADKGAHTFTGLKLKKKGTQTITLTDTSNSTVTGTISINVG
jgi:probable HAF family extracellular repeat protein